MDYFARTLRRYLTLALVKSGARLNVDDEAELDAMCTSIASRLAVIERRLDVLENNRVGVYAEAKPKRKRKGK